jgi:hypothetical protein
MASLDQVLYTANAHTTGGRDGASRTDDGRLDVKLSSPGTAGTGTNPEQLFAAGYSACFIGAMKAVAGMQKITLPQDLAVDASVDLGKVGCRLWHRRAPGHEPARHGPRRRPGPGGRGPPGLPLLQRHARQHRRDHHAGQR